MCVCERESVCVRVCRQDVCMCACVCTHAHSNTNTQTHIHTYTHTHTHTHTHGKQARPEHVGTSDMIYIKGHQGEWLTLAGRTRIVFSLV